MNNLKLKVTKYANAFFIFSLILTVVSLGAFFFKGLDYGIDFKGGTIMTIELNKQVNTNEVSSIISKYDKQASISFAGDNKTQVVISTKLDLTEAQRNEIFSEFSSKYNLTQADLLSTDNVSATIGNELKSQAIIACLIAVLGILIYVTIRFEFLFGLCAVVSLLHDLIIVIGVYAIFRVQVNTPFIAAMLTILGYSINDTIVVFDRVRENRKKYAKYDFGNLIDDSVNQTLTRSIFTTITTLIAIIPLFIFGGASIKEFVFPMIIGFISGAYSSIFVASTMWYKIKVYLAKKQGIDVEAINSEVKLVSNENISISETAGSLEDSIKKEDLLKNQIMGKGKAKKPRKKRKSKKQ